MTVRVRIRCTGTIVSKLCRGMVARGERPVKVASDSNPHSLDLQSRASIWILPQDSSGQLCLTFIALFPWMLRKDFWSASRRHRVARLPGCFMVETDCCKDANMDKSRSVVQIALDNARRYQVQLRRDLTRRYGRVICNSGAG